MNVSQFIALQKRGDDLAMRLREAGDTEGVKVVMELEREMRGLWDRLERIRWAVQPE